MTNNSENKKENQIDFGVLPSLSKNKKKAKSCIFISIIALILTSCWLVLKYTSDQASSFNNNELSTVFMNSGYQEVQYQIIRYAKNLQRFYVYFKDFSAEGNDNIGNKEDTTDEEGFDIQNQLYAERDRKLLTLTQNFNAVSLEISKLLQNDQFSPGLRDNPLREQNSISPTGDTVYNAIFPDFSLLEQSSISAIEAANYYMKNFTNPLERLQLDFNTTREKIIEDYDNRINLINSYDMKALEEEKLVNYRDVKRYIETTKYLNYYISNIETDEVFTNITSADPLSVVESAKIKFSITNDPVFKNEMFNNELLADSFYSNNLNGYIIIPDEILESQNDNDIYGFYEHYLNLLEKNQQLSKLSGLYFILSIITPLIIILAVLLETKNTTRFLKRLRDVYAKIPVIIKALLIIASISWLPEVSTQFYSDAFNHNITRSQENVFLFLFLFTIFTALAILWIIISLMHVIFLFTHFSKLKDEPEVKFIINFFSDLIFVFKQNNIALTKIMVLLIFIAVMSQVILLFTFYNLSFYFYQGFVTFFLIEVILVCLCLISFYVIIALSRVNFYTDEIINGTLDEIDMKRGFFKSIILKLNLLRGGVRKVIVERNKSDRLKNELITNVSHDLKTPLTSIINYIELLKQDSLSEYDRKDYISVLESKSQRLKVLIEDLFEATKLSSGQIQLQKDRLNIVAILKQTMGELDEQIEESGVIFKFSTNSEQCYSHVDGKKIWRVFENLIINITKYSQSGTRAYIDLVDELHTITITFKSTSNYEMNFDSSELFERFKRGDESRTTEGSGLGLSIAKDIIELHGGTMEIMIDGDLFKVIIKLDVSNENE